MYCTRLAENTGRKNDAKNRHLRTIAQLCRTVSSQQRHVSTIGKKLAKQQYVLHISSQHGERRPINGWDPLASLRHPSKFQRVSRLAFVTAATSLIGGQPNFTRCLAVSWAATLYMHFRGLLPPDRILPGGKFTFHPSLVFSYIGSVLLHGTPAAGDVRRCTRNGITELSHRAPPIFSRAAITLGIGPHSSYNCIIKNIFYCPECT